jgi:hypothetical protein
MPRLTYTWCSRQAALYSAAFILRRVAAERLDIDPEELDVSGVRQVELDNGARVGEIVINDYLPQWLRFHSLAC